MVGLSRTIASATAVLVILPALVLPVAAWADAETTAATSEVIHQDVLETSTTVYPEPMPPSDPDPDPDSETETDSETDPEAEGNADVGWLDRSHRGVSNRTDKLAVWADNFFGSPRSVEESPTSVLRLRPRYEWDEEEGSDWKLRVTGRLKLPRVNKRLSLVFIKDDGDPGSEFYDPGIASDGSDTAGLQYRLAKSDTSKVNLIAGFKGGPKGKLGGRYRYQVPFLKRNRFRFSEELFWIGGDGFGTLTRVDIDHSPDKSTLWRWANKGEYSEESNGVEWSTRLWRVVKLDEKSALSTFGFLNGETDQKILKNRGFGVSYRRQFLRDWLFWEIEPLYTWRKSRPEDEREGVAIIKLEFEMVFGSER
jgi:hypothetical protein